MLTIIILIIFLSEDCHATILSSFAHEGAFRHAPQGDDAGKGTRAHIGSAQDPRISFRARGRGTKSHRTIL